MGTAQIRRGSKGLPAALLAIVVFVSTLALPHPADAQVDAERWEVIPDESMVVVRVDRAGLLSFLGHRHAIVPHEWSGALCLEGTSPPTGSGRLSIETGSLVIDSDSARALAGLDDGPGEDDRREIQEKMLSSRFLAAEEHPEIVLETTGLRVDDDEVEVRIDLTIRGETREVEVPVRFEDAGDGRLRLHGEVEVRQSEFGIEPESVAGVVNVDDEVELLFDLTVEPTARACTPGP